MRHRLDKKFFNRDTKSRRSLLNGVVVALFEHGEIETTRAKGKEAMRLAESCITHAKVGDLAAKRTLHRIFGRRDVVNNLVDRVAPVFKDRQSGFCRLTLIGNRRGDNTEMYRLSLVEVLPARPAKEDQQSTAVAKKAKTTNHQHDQAARAAVAKDKTIDEKVSKQKAGLEQKVSRRQIFGGGRGK